MAEYEDMLFGEIPTSDGKVLIELTENLKHTYKNCLSLGSTPASTISTLSKTLSLPDRKSSHQVHCEEK